MLELTYDMNKIKRMMVMSINYAILGLLSWKELSGYGLKKIIINSSYMYWSANNNQIYKGLIKLKKDGLIKSETIHSDDSPSKKIYFITQKGKDELKKWILSPLETSVIKNTFLIKLAWSDILTNEELKSQIGKYEEDIHTQILLSEEIKKRNLYSPMRTKREEILWDMINDNVISYYQNEMRWVRNLKNKLGII